MPHVSGVSRHIQLAIDLERVNCLYAGCDALQGECHAGDHYERHQPWAFPVGQQMIDEKPGKTRLGNLDQGGDGRDQAKEQDVLFASLDFFHHKGRYPLWFALRHKFRPGRHDQADSAVARFEFLQREDEAAPGRIVDVGLVPFKTFQNDKMVVIPEYDAGEGGLCL